MKFVNIMGKTSDIDRIITKYISKYEIQFEDAVSEISNEAHIYPFVASNEYSVFMKDSEALMKIINDKDVEIEEISCERAISIINEVSKQIADKIKTKQELNKEKEKLEQLKLQIEPFKKLDFPVEKLLKFDNIKFRFGKMPRDSYKKFETYIDQLSVFFVTSIIEADYVWGIYFTTELLRESIDPVFASLHFERIHISNEFVGTPTEIYDELNFKILDIENQINTITKNQSDEINSRKNEIVSAHVKIVELNDNFAIKKYAAQMKGTVVDAYIIVGWMEERDAEKLKEDLKDDLNGICLIEDENLGIKSKPPTKLKNPSIFKPFELFTKMYGMPSYDEFDPTIFLALTYTFIFGMMFGDVGQGLLLVIGGAVLYKLKNMALAAIISFAGIFSICFGFAYGSFFGFESIVPTLWLKPMEDTNTILIVSVAFGIILIFVSMIINIINKFKQGKIGEALFDPNGVSGFLFYAISIGVAVNMLVGGIDIPNVVIVLGITIPLILTAFKIPLSRAIEHKKQLILGSKGEFFIEAFFETFEVILSYVTNTISFVRIGAFALSHAGMMSVVHMLAGDGNSPMSILILVLGNILVMGMEGLVVGIQVLRLEYYEMFSRFYTAKGEEFRPYKQINN